MRIQTPKYVLKKNKTVLDKNYTLTASLTVFSIFLDLSFFTGYC
ncbi:hypothetical protein [Lawsonia intracellularis]|nr:hypothetical protein [Lawsonia intracellularis]